MQGRSSGGGGGGGLRVSHTSLPQKSSSIPHVTSERKPQRVAAMQNMSATRRPQRRMLAWQKAPEDAGSCVFTAASTCTRNTDAITNTIKHTHLGPAPLLRMSG